MYICVCLLHLFVLFNLDQCKSLEESASDGQYKLVHSDEFDGPSLDRRKWYHLVDCSGRGNKELQCYTNRTSNVRIQDGHLIIEAIREDYETKNYTSGRVHTSGKGWTFGKFEARARLPAGKHLWPAIWLVPTNGVYGSWPQSGEIDIVEQRGQNTSSIEGTVHFGSSRRHRSKVGSSQIVFDFDFSKDFHVFTFEWTKEFMSWSVDDIEFFKMSTRRSFNVDGGEELYKKEGQPFDQNFKWILNLAIGGSYFSDHKKFGHLEHLESQQWAKPTMEVDYVRVYQKIDSYSSNSTSESETETETETTVEEEKDADVDKYPNYVDDYYYDSDDTVRNQDTYYYD